MRRAVSVTCRNGASVRPAMSQPKAAATPPTTASAMPPCVMSEVVAAFSIRLRSLRRNFWAPAPVSSSPLRVTTKSLATSAPDASPSGDEMRTLPPLLICWWNSPYVDPSSTMPAAKNSPP
jgi:hypothetical protein